MDYKNRTVALGVVVVLFIVANIIAGIFIYRSTRTTPQKQVAQVGETVETGKQPPEVKAQDTGVKAPEPQVAEAGVQKDSTEAVIEEKRTAQSGEDSQPGSGTAQSEQEQQIAAYEREKSRLEKDIVRLREALRDKQALAAENQQLSEQVRECIAERERLQKESAGLQTNDEKYKEISAQNEKLTSQIEAHAKETDNYKKEIANLQKRVDQYNNMVSENKKLQAQLGDAKRQNDALKERLDKISAIVQGE